MDKKENSSSGQSEAKAGSKPAKEAQNNSGKSGISAKLNVTTKRRKKREVKLQEWIALITAILTAITSIVVALINSHDNKPSPTLIPTFTTMPSSTPFFTETSIVFTDTLSPTTLPSFTSTITATPLLFETITPSPQPKLIVLVTANKNSGKAPLKVKFDARQSFLTDYSGQRYVCKNGPCSYVWKVYLNGQPIGKSNTDSGGTFDYSFGQKGTYTVSVWICRGQNKIDCGGSGVQIVVT